MKLETLRTQCNSCHRCDELSRLRRTVVFGSGNPDAGLLFVGEAPGQDEDILGLPFVGKSGKLLDKLLAVHDLNRDKNLFIANLIKCRPPGNRKPTKQEIDNCIGYLYQQIEILAPRVIVTLGSFPAGALLQNNAPISKIRGQIHEIQVNNQIYKLIPTFHPSYLIRNGATTFITEHRTNDMINLVLGDIGLAKSLLADSNN